MYEQLHSTDHKDILIEGANANMLDIDFGLFVRICLVCYVTLI